MTKPILAIDFDGPLAWSGGYEKFLRFAEVQGHRVDWNAWHATHHVDSALPELKREDVNALSQHYHHSMAGSDMQPVPHAHGILMKYLAQLSYAIVTARQDYAEKLMRVFLQKEYSSIPFQNIFTGYAYRKGEALLACGAQLIIEDNVHEALKIVEQAPDVTVILFPTFIPETHTVQHSRIHLTEAYKEALRAQDLSDTDKLLSLQTAWLEVDHFLANWLASQTAA